MRQPDGSREDESREVEIDVLRRASRSPPTRGPSEPGSGCEPGSRVSREPGDGPEQTLRRSILDRAADRQCLADVGIERAIRGVGLQAGPVERLAEEAARSGRE